MNLKASVTSIFLMCILLMSPYLTPSRQSEKEIEAVTILKRSTKRFIDSEGLEGVNKSHNDHVVSINTSKIAIEIEIPTNFGTPRFHFSRPGTNTTYHARPLNLVEYMDQNGDGAFQWDELVKGERHGTPLKFFHFHGQHGILAIFTSQNKALILTLRCTHSILMVPIPSTCSQKI